MGRWRADAGWLGLSPIEPGFTLAIARGDTVAAFDLIGLENRLMAWRDERPPGAGGMSGCPGHRDTAAATAESDGRMVSADGL